MRSLSFRPTGTPLSRRGFLWLCSQGRCVKAAAPSEQRLSLRVTAPVCFRQLSRNDPKSIDSPCEVVQALAASTGVQVSELLGGTWTRDEAHSRDLFGFLRVKATTADKLLASSGLCGVFVSKPPEPNRPKPFWLHCEPTEQEETYFRRAVKLSTERNQCWIYRAGSGSNLGFPAWLPTDSQPERIKHVVDAKILE